MDKRTDSDNDTRISTSTKSSSAAKPIKTTNTRPQSSVRSDASHSPDSSETNNYSEESSLEGVINPTNRLISSSVSFLESIATSQETKRSSAAKTLNLFRKKKDPLKKFYSRFPIVSTQSNFVYYTYYKCTLERGFGSRGKLYITNRDLFFYGKLLGRKTKLQIPYQDILHMDKLQHPSSIRVTTMSSQYVLSHFKKIDSTFAVLVHLWQCHIDGIEPPSYFEESSTEYGSTQEQLPTEKIKNASLHSRKQSKDDLSLPRRDTAKQKHQSSLKRRSSFVIDPRSTRDDITSITQIASTKSHPGQYRQESREICKYCLSSHYKYNMINETFLTNPHALISILFGDDIDELHSQALYTNEWVKSKGISLLHIGDWNMKTKERRLVYEIPITEKLESFYQGEVSIIVIEVQQWKHTENAKTHLLESLFLFPSGKFYQESTDDSEYEFYGIEVKMKYCISSIPEAKCNLSVTADINVISDAPSTPNAQIKFAHIMFIDMSLLNDLLLKRLHDDLLVIRVGGKGISSDSVWNGWRIGNLLSWRPVMRLPCIHLNSISRSIIYGIRMIRKSLSNVYFMLFYGTFPIFLYIEDSYTIISEWYRRKVSPNLKHKRLLVLIFVWMMLNGLLIWIFLWGGEESFVSINEHHMLWSYWSGKGHDVKIILYRSMKRELERISELLNRIQSHAQFIANMAF